MTDLIIIPLIIPPPVWYWVGAAVFSAIGLGTGIAYFSNKKNKLGLLGMKTSGKTTLLNKLRKIEEVPTSTGKEPYDSFEYAITPDHTIYIDKGIDMGGAKNYMADYEKIIQKNDVIFYFFNIHQYLTEIGYKRECNSRLAYINPRMNDKKFAVIATHPDQSRLNETELKEEMLNHIRDKPYSKLFNDDFHIVNLTNNKEVNKLIEHIFKYK